MISKVTGCSKADKDPTAKITDDTQKWRANEWQGGVKDKLAHKLQVLNSKDS